MNKVKGYSKLILMLVLVSILIFWRGLANDIQSGSLQSVGTDKDQSSKWSTQNKHGLGRPDNKMIRDPSRVRQENSNVDLAADKQLSQSHSATKDALFEQSRVFIERLIDELIGRARQQGTVRIIIGIRTPFQSEGNLKSVSAVGAQRAAITRSQDLILRRLTGYDPASIKRFETIPFLAMEISVNGLERLRTDNDVVSIQEDIALAPLLTESTRIVGATNAWARGFSGAGQTIAILDTGVDKNHSFLAGKVVSEACYSTNIIGNNVMSLCPGGVTESTSSGSGLNCSPDISGCDHGTHVAGIAAGRGINYSGVARDANLIAIQVFSRIDSPAGCLPDDPAPCVRTYTSDYTKGLERVMILSSSFKIAAVNMSLGGGKFFSNCDSEHPIVTSAINNLRSVGIATIIASGNDEFTDALDSPACISSAISVGSTDDGSLNTVLDDVSPFSNSASFLNLLAPGQWITSSVPGGGFEAKRGTSMAAPHIAGAWAIIKSRLPSASIEQILSALTNTGIPILDSRNGITKPRIQVDTALDAIINSPTADLAINKSATPDTAGANSTVTYRLQVTNAGPGIATSVVITDNLPQATSFIACSSDNGGICGGSGNNRTVSFSSLAAGVSASISLIVRVNCAAVTGSSISNAATVSSSTPDPDSSNNMAITVVNAAPGQARVTLGNGGGSFDFGSVTMNREPNPFPPSNSFTIENTGCLPLMAGLMVNRTGVDVSSGKIANSDDSATFPVILINSNGAEIPLTFFGGSSQFQIKGGQQQRFRMAFNPLIPAPAGGVNNLSAGHVLPPLITSALTIRQDNIIHTTVPLVGRISTAARMINPLATRLSPLVALARSGAELEVEFSVFDSNLDSYLAVYQFLDGLNRPIGDAPNFDLEQPIRQSGLLPGQSFTVVKRFIGTSALSQVNKVKVTLYDREGNESVLSGEIGKVIGRVVNVSAASFQEAGLASEAITSAFGTNLAASTQISSALTLPTSLGGTRVFVRDSSNVERLAPLFFIAPSQINYQIPTGTSAGPAVVTVGLNDQAMATATVNVVMAAPGLFSANANGQGVAAAVALRVRPDGSQIYEPVSVFDQAQNRLVSRPISLGAETEQVYLVLFGTGIRHRSALSNVRVMIGGVDAAVEYAGPQYGFVGLDQVNIRLPRALSGRGEVDIILTVDGRQSNIVKFNVY